jgi:hypothetical protein
MCSHHLEKGDGADEVVVIVQQGLLDALANSFEPSKVNHSLKPVGRKDVLERVPVAKVNLVEDEVAAVVAGELGDAEEGDLGGVVEVVDDDDAEALLEQLQHGVAADVPGAARHQDGPQHGGHHLLLLDSDRSGEGGRGRGLLARKKEGEDRPEFGGGGMERWAVRALDEF